MFMAINGQFIEGYQMRYRKVYSVIFHLQPVLSRIPLDDKSILSNSVRKPINIQLKRSFPHPRTIYTCKQAQASLIRNHRIKQRHIRPEDEKPSDTGNGDRVKT